MRKLLRRIRGAIGMGLTWGAAWGVAGTLVTVATRFSADAPFAFIFGLFGFIAGSIFSLLLALIDGRRRLDEMSLARFAMWGATGGLLLSAVLINAASLGWQGVLTVAPAFALASALCASGSLALARRAALRELASESKTYGDAELADAPTTKLRGAE